MDAVVPAAPRSLQLGEILREVLLHPSVETFQRILADPKRSTSRIFKWMMLYYATFGVISVLFLPSTLRQGAGATILWILATVLLGPLLFMVGLLIGAWVLHLVASWFGGSGTTDRLAYVLGILNIYLGIVGYPLSVLTSIIANQAENGSSLLSLCTVPFSLALAVYGVYLQVQAVRAEEEITAGKAFLTIILPGIIVIALGFACMLLALVPFLRQTVGQ